MRAFAAAVALIAAFSLADVLKAPRDHRAPPVRPGLPDRQVRKERPDHPDRKERRDWLEPSALPARPVRRAPRAVSVQRGLRVPRVRLDRREPPACTQSARRRATASASFYAALGKSLFP